MSATCALAQTSGRHTVMSLGLHTSSKRRYQRPFCQPYSSGRSASFDSTPKEDGQHVTAREPPAAVSESSEGPANTFAKPPPLVSKPVVPYAYEPWTGPVPPWLRVPSFKPENIKDSDWVDLSDSFFKVDERAGSSPTFYYTLRRTEAVTPFPPHTHGFFYWTCAPGVPRLRAEIRFRITSQRSARWFAFGRDLLDMYGLPWRLSVLGLSAHRHFDWVVDQLLREDLLSFPEVRPYSRYLENSGLLGLPYISHHVDAGDEAPFGYNFGTSSPASAWIITSLPFLHRIGLRTFFRIDGAVAPRSGSAIFSVEWQYDRLKPGRYFYALRCHKIVEPLIYPSANDRLALAAVAKAAGRILESTISPQEDDTDASRPVDTQPGSPRCEIAEGHLVSLGGKPLLWARAYNGGPPRDEDDRAAAGASK